MPNRPPQAKGSLHLGPVFIGLRTSAGGKVMVRRVLNRVSGYVSSVGLKAGPEETRPTETKAQVVGGLPRNLTLNSSNYPAS